MSKSVVSVSELEKVLLSLPPSIQSIYRILSKGNPMSLADIRSQTSYCHRTIHEALRFLERERLIIKKPNLRDMRRCFYQTSFFCQEEVVDYAKSTLDLVQDWNQS